VTSSLSNGCPFFTPGCNQPWGNLCEYQEWSGEIDGQPDFQALDAAEAYEPDPAVILASALSPIQAADSPHPASS
jgi:hypothetical protein